MLPDSNVKPFSRPVVQLLLRQGTFGFVLVDLELPKDAQHAYRHQI